jgi:heme-degrading monooxygenase HmoA
MILRIWHGWTEPENADAYERLLREEIFAGIRGRDIPGFRGIKLLRDDAGNESEFVTLMEFDSIEAVRRFAGDNYEKAVVPDAAQKLLKRFDHASRHYEIRET